MQRQNMHFLLRYHLLEEIKKKKERLFFYLQTEMEERYCIMLLTLCRSLLEQDHSIIVVVS